MAKAAIVLRIKADHFVAGVEIYNRGPNRCAPILKYMTNWSYQKILNYCKQRKWHVEELQT